MLRRKLSSPPEERDALGSEEVLEGTGSMNYLLNAEATDEGKWATRDVQPNVHFEIHFYSASISH